MWKGGREKGVGEGGGGGGHIRVLVLQATTCDFLRLDKRGLEMWDSAIRSQLWAFPIEIAPRILQPHLPCSRLLVAIDMARLRRIGKSGNVISLCRRLHWSPARKGAQFDLYEASVRQGLTDLRSHGSDFVSVLAATRIPPNLFHACAPQIQISNRSANQSRVLWRSGRQLESTGERLRAERWRFMLMELCHSDDLERLCSLKAKCQ